MDLWQITMDFNPFDILPDCLPAVSEAVPVYAAVAHVPAPSVLKSGNNGNNTPKIGEAFNAILEKRREGRMSLFTEEKAAKIIEGIEEGLTMEDIAESIGHERRVIWSWMQLSPEFHHAVTQAREYQGHSSADNAVKILDNVIIDPDNPKAAMAELRKAEQRARIRMELAKAFNFKQYGDKKQNLNLNINADVSPVDLSNYGM